MNDHGIVWSASVQPTGLGFSPDKFESHKK